VTLEAFARCPLCKRNDQVEKVSAILHKQTSQSDGFIPQQKIYTDSQGHAYSRTVNVPVQTIQASDLARKLAPPPPPTKPASRPIVILLLFAIILAVAGVCGFMLAITGFTSFYSYDQTGAISSSIIMTLIMTLVCGFVPFLASAGMFVLWHSLRKKEQDRIRQEQSAINDANLKWQQARSRWEILYYCGRDDIVFIPGEKTSATVADMIAYLYTNP
jgi:hypothetical protein